jgi:hypothetical protein
MRFAFEHLMAEASNGVSVDTVPFCLGIQTSCCAMESISAIAPFTQLSLMSEGMSSLLPTQ